MKISSKAKQQRYRKMHELSTNPIATHGSNQMNDQEYRVNGKVVSAEEYARAAAENAAEAPAEEPVEETSEETEEGEEEQAGE
jgi:hypothetical protein